MKRSFVRRSLTVVATGMLLALASFALAAGDDRAVAETTLREVDALAKKSAATDLVARAKASLDRSQKLRAAGDEAHARLSDRAARTWAEAARDAARAAEAEESAATARTGATDAGLAADRERALLEEAIAQSGRLRAQLESAGTETKVAKTSTSAKNDSAATAKRDGGAAAPLPASGGPAPAPGPRPVRDGGAQ